MLRRSSSKIPEESKLNFVQLAVLGWRPGTLKYGLVHYIRVKWCSSKAQAVSRSLVYKLAKAAGAITITTSSLDKKLKFVKEKLRVVYTINYRKMPGWAAEATNGTGADFVIETGGSGTNAKSIDATKPGGQIGVIGFLSRAKQEEMPGVAGLVLNKDILFAVFRSAAINSPKSWWACQEAAGHISKIGIAVKTE
ncbi:hypothetical protein PI124_g18517 [Phytophthora idaei]|nr:hypothetical protein PI125_g24588 [Phytophthora idaei]KAG3125850.1 hypothetical protein PI126_g22587 [Phytophthora idaei]KAG3236470.1 hypothetical protein PI124_g18517 [Phytophthora idaei]